ncbi:MAG: flagellar basal body P-ring formation chaperone FlgA [Fibrobacterota bacterium]
MKEGRIFLFLLFSAAVPVTAAQIIFRENAEVRGEKIHLSDIADIRGAEKGYLDTLYVGRAPHPGKIRYISGRDSFSRLKLRDTLENNIQISGAQNTTVLHGADTLLPAEMLPRLHSVLGDSLESESVDISIQESSLRRPVVLSRGKEYTLTLSEIRGRSNRGNCRAVFLFESESYTQTLSVQVRIEEEAKVPLSTGRYSRGEKIRPENITWERRDISDLHSPPLTRDDFTAVLRAKNTIRPGTVLTQTNAEESPAIVRGEKISLMYRTERMQLSLNARARQDGYVGDIIRVENTQNHTMLTARVVDTGVAEIYKGGRL